MSGFDLANYLGEPATRAASEASPLNKIFSGKIRGKHLAIGLFVVMGLTLITFAAIIGRGQGDEGCQCTSPDQAGWNWASAVILVLSVALLGMLLWDPSLLVASA